MVRSRLKALPPSTGGFWFPKDKLTPRRPFVYGALGDLAVSPSGDFPRPRRIQATLLGPFVFQHQPEATGAAAFMYLGVE